MKLETEEPEGRTLKTLLHMASITGTLEGQNNCYPWFKGSASKQDFTSALIRPSN